MALSQSERKAKLQRLAELEGFSTIDEMFDAAVTDVTSPGICINTVPWCEYTAEVAYNCRDGYCPNCGTNTVQSAPVLSGLV